MTAERIRVYKGATELSYGSLTISKSNDHLINTAKIRIEANANVTQGAIIDFTKNDGSTKIFSGKVIEIKQGDLWDVTVLTNGYELNNLRVENVYENKSPEYIVQDIIDNYTENLTFASSSSSGFTISKYIAKGYAIDIIKDMLETLGWQFKVDESDNAYFEPKGNTDNGVTLTNGTNFQITSWNEDQKEMMNHIKVIGGFEGRSTTETVVGTDTTFSLTYKPSGSFKAVVSGSEIDPDDYEVDPDNKDMTFDSSQTDPTFTYDFNKPVVVENQDDTSVNTYGEIYKEIQAPWLDSTSLARKYTQQLLDNYARPIVSVKAVEYELNFTREVGEKITVVDGIRSKSAELIISKIEFNADMNTTTYEMGSRDYVLFDWQRETQDRIKKLERRTTNEEVTTFVRLLKHDMAVTLTLSQVWEYNSPVDSFFLNHKTLNRLRNVVNGNVLNYEADCSGTDSGHPGTWSGTGVDGDQYSTSGWRLSCGQFNGSDRIITVSDHADLDLSSDFSIAFAVKVTSLPDAETYLFNKWDGTDGWAVRIASDNKVEMIYSNSSSDSTLKASTALTANTWQHVVFTKSGTDLIVYINGSSDNTGSGDAAAGTNTNDLIVGNYSSNYFNGFLDEIRLYTAALNTTQVGYISAKIEYETNNVLYLSMDNPKLGDRFTARQTIT